MDNKLNILFIEDDINIISLFVSELMKGNFFIDAHHADNSAQILKFIDEKKPDIIFCEYSLPNISLNEALNIFKTSGLEIPFIGISGEFGDEFACEVINPGACDYIHRDNLFRLVPVVKRELENAKIRRERNKFQKNLLNLSSKFTNKFEEQTHKLKDEIENLKCKIVDYQQKLEAKENKTSFLQTILDNLPYAVYVRDADTLKHTFVNKKVEEFTGFTNEDLVGKSAYDIFSKELADVLSETDINFLKINKPVDMVEELHKTKHNGFRLFETKKSLINLDNSGHPFILNICNDITYKNNIDRGVVENELKFSKLFKSSPISMVVLKSPDSVILDFNNSFLELTGYEEYEILNRPILEMNIWKDINEYKRLFDFAKEFGKVENQEVSLVNKYGRVMTAVVSIEYIKSEEDNPWLIITAQDISQWKEADEEIRLALEKEKDLNLLKTRFISMVSHEFRTPLTSIMLSTDLLRRYGDRWSDEERNKHFDRIQRTILNMTYLLENVLTVGKMETGRFDYRPEEIELPVFCKSLTENVQFITGEVNPIKLICSDEIRNVTGDHNLLNLIFTNLLTNAVKYSPKGSEITFEVKPNCKTMLFYVKDHGIGIPKEDMENLFKTYFRASNTGTVLGYGLGLSIVKRCVDSHHGEIEVDSEPGKGTTFLVKIPFSN